MQSQVIVSLDGSTYAEAILPHALFVFAIPSAALPPPQPLLKRAASLSAPQSSPAPR